LDIAKGLLGRDKLYRTEMGREDAAAPRSSERAAK
jgi:hypothetical protein